MAGSSGGRGKSLGEAGGFWVNSLFSPEVPRLGRKFRGSPEVPGVVEFLPGRTLNSRSENGGGKTRFPGAKFRRFRGWKWGKDGGKLDPLETKQIHGSNPTKHHQTNKSQKKLGLFLVGIFEIGEEHNKTMLENRG